jgi:hypothetical protein
VVIAVVGLFALLTSCPPSKLHSLLSSSLLPRHHPPALKKKDKVAAIYLHLRAIVKAFNDGLGGEFRNVHTYNALSVHVNGLDGSMKPVADFGSDLLTLYVDDALGAVTVVTVPYKSIRCVRVISGTAVKGAPRR